MQQRKRHLESQLQVNGLMEFNEEDAFACVCVDSCYGLGKDGQCSYLLVLVIESSGLVIYC